MSNKPINVIEPVNRALTERLQVFAGRSLTRTTCMEIYQTMFNTLVDIFSMSKSGISNESVNFVAQALYECITLNNHDDSLDPTIFTQKASLKNVPMSDLVMLSVMFREHFIATEALAEIKHRS
jgi:hypothetical protein